MNADTGQIARRTEFAFSAADHRAIATFVHAEAGIMMPPAKAQLVYGRLAPRVRQNGFTTFADYIALIRHDQDERARAIDALTTNHTSFFREAHHYGHFLKHVWPTLEQRLEKGGRVRIWSAACSSGEEPYSLLMALFGPSIRNGRRLAGTDLRVLATDLSSKILAVAEAGRYPADALRGIPAPLLATWVRRAGDEAEVHPLLREPLALRKLNLLEDWPMRRPFDAIFCRNVMIYFDERTKARLQARISDQLAPGGLLYIGHSERLAASVAQRFECVGRTSYRKVST